jgi:hypothetical protein
MTYQKFYQATLCLVSEGPLDGRQLSQVISKANR